jgi:hypothetical protein
LQWTETISDGGGAIGKACAHLDPAVPHGHDSWHLLHRWTQALARLARHHATLETRTATVQRQADRCAAGQKPLGRTPSTDVDAHARQVAHAAQQVADVRTLGQELHALLAVVILRPAGVASLADRAADLEAVLALLAEVRDAAAGTTQKELVALYKATARVQERVLVFAERLDPIQQISIATLGCAAVRDIAWAWQRRAVLEWHTANILDAIPAAWRGVAQVLLAAWNDAVRASSWAEVWHSLLRPHLAVHRRLSPGMLALLAVYHNHRVYDRGAHVGVNPLQLSGIADAPTDWWTALGYTDAAPSLPMLDTTTHAPATTLVQAA